MKGYSASARCGGGDGGEGRIPSQVERRDIHFAVQAGDTLVKLWPYCCDNRIAVVKVI